MGPSLSVNRDCSLCPTAFTEIPEMQRHIRRHLERLALFSLPAGEDDEDGGAGMSAQSHQVIQGRGRRDSIEQDFDDDDAEDDRSAPHIDNDAYEPASLATIQQHFLLRPTEGEHESSESGNSIYRWIEVLEPGSEDVEDGVANPNDAPLAAAGTTATNLVPNVSGKPLFFCYSQEPYQDATAVAKH